MCCNYSYDDLRLKHSAIHNRTVFHASGGWGIASVSRQATEFGLNILKNGGNAFDAAFAIAFALAFYHPQAGNIGGGGYLIFRKAGDKTPLVIDYRERAPKSAKINNYIDKNGEVNQEATSFGPSSICTPGTVKCFCFIQKKYGRLDQGFILRELTKEMEQGAVITGYQANCFNRLSKKLSVCEESRKHFVKQNGEFKAGDRIYNKELIKTYLRIAEKGGADFYTGKLSEMIEEDVCNNGGFLTVEDLKEYQIKIAEPVYGEFKNYRIWSVPPEGGGSILIDIINLLNNKKFYGVKPFSPEFYGFIVEASKIAFKRKLHYHGDTDLSKNDFYTSIFKKEKAKEIFYNKVLPIIENQVDPSFPLKLNEMLESQNKNLPELKNDNNYGSVEDSVNKKEGTQQLNEFPDNSGETTHFTVIDRWGNVVSNSYTLNLRYGSKWSIRGAGFLMNGSMDAFTFVPGKPNYFNIVGSRYNLFAPRKRPASNMSPVIITDRDGDVVAALGTPGGPAIPTTLATIILSYLLGEDPVTSVREYRVHHQGFPDVLYWEEGFDKNKLFRLEKMGYRLKMKDEPLGDVHGAFKVKSGYVFISDYRREGFAASEN